MTAGTQAAPDLAAAARLTVLAAASVHDPEASVSPSLWTRVEPHYRALERLVAGVDGEVAAALAAHGRGPGDRDRRARLETAVAAALAADPQRLREARRLLRLIAEFGRLLPHESETYRDTAFEPVEQQIQRLLGAMRPRPVHRHDPHLVVVVSYRVAQAGTDRMRNLLCCLNALHATHDPDRVRIVAVEQDDRPRTAELVGPLVDRYVFAPNPGLFNYAWGRNVGVRAAATDAPVCLLDADMVVGPEFVAQCVEALRDGAEALLPYDRLLYLDARSSATVVADVATGRGVSADGAGLRGYIMREIYGGAIVATRELFDRVGGQDERYRGWGDEDNEFYFMLRRNGVLRRSVGWLYHLDHARPPMRDGTLRINRAAMAVPRSPGGEYGDPARYSRPADPGTAHPPDEKDVVR
ncbi:galactosyltransferase-related protein [Dactylosporangium sp. NBC_01737]|uniref:glycosyltransferase family 2 protein n=1 Tax=Dactylosporangium sp. NBC_01737 TaxID=2975959 RepID=UPI002E0E784E|nr:galactosyltransferase-related protein [Dactylosporangium sp. NBC_01737]